MSSEETQTLSLCQSCVPGDGVLLAHVLSRQGIREPLRPFRLYFPGRPGSATRQGQGVGPHERFPPRSAVDHPRDTAKARPCWNRAFPARTVEAGRLRREAQLSATQAGLSGTLSICVSYVSAADQASETRQLSSPGLPDEDSVT